MSFNQCYGAKDFEIWDKPTYRFDEIGSLMAKRKIEPKQAEAITIKERNKVVRLKDMASFLHIFLHNTSYNLAKYEQGDIARLAMARNSAGHAVSCIDRIIKEVR